MKTMNIRDGMRWVLLALPLLLLAGCGSSNSDGALDGLVNPGGGDGGGGGGGGPPTPTGWRMVWSDEFDGNTLNRTDWTFEIGKGVGGWGNNELQYYQEDNVTVAGGMLTIEAREEAAPGSSYTSARIKTQGKRSFRYGRVEIRARLPEGQGIWPALWMLGESISTVGWPHCGEIDIMEMIGGMGREDTVHGTIHFDNNGAYRFSGEQTSPLPAGETFADDFHLFSIEWDSQQIEWFVDGERYHIESLIGSAKDEFRDDFFFLFNVAVGGNWPGSPDLSTGFPQQMVVDYIRVYEAE